MIWSFLLACSGDSPPTYYADIKPIVDAHCGDCHVEGGLAPYSFETPEEAVNAAVLIRLGAESGAMPPWGAADLVDFPLRYNVSLSPEQIDLIARWEEAGAPLGDPAEEGAPIVLEKAALERVDARLSLAEPYTPDTAELDDYRCFVIDWEEDERAWVTGFVGVPDFIPVVHHMLAFIVSPGDVETIEGYDEQAEGPGYPCFGFVTSTDAPDDIVNARILGQWAPGTGAVRVGEGSGVPVEPGSRIVLQMHYSTAVPELQPDQSGLDVELVREAPDEDAHIVVWTNLSWFLGVEDMHIPADEAAVTHSHTATFVGSGNVRASGAGDDLEQGANITSILPHMHKLGRTLDVEIVRSTGVTERVLSIPDWDFGWQRQYTFESPVFVGPEDEVTVRCTWDNSSAYREIVDVSPESVDLGWGEGTYDEMCAAILTVTP